MSPDMATLVNELRVALPAAARMTADSRRVGPGDVFLAFPGDIHDGRDYIANALAAGAAAVLWEPEGHAWSTDAIVLQKPVAGLRGHAAELAATWYGEPSRGLWMVGVTGTRPPVS